MYDSDNPGDIPANAEAVAGYLDLWPAAAWDRFSNASVKRHIARFATQDGDTLDVEAGLATPAEAPGWARRRLASGVVRPWVYCNLSTKPALFAAMAAAGLALHRDWEWWSAGYFDNAGDPPRLDPDAIATQYGHVPYTGGHYDLSLVADSWADGTGAPQEDIMDESFKHATVWTWYWKYLGRSPEVAGHPEDDWVGAIGPHGENAAAVVYGIATSPEASGRRLSLERHPGASPTFHLKNQLYLSRLGREIKPQEVGLWNIGPDGEGLEEMIAAVQASPEAAAHRGGTSA